MTLPKQEEESERIHVEFGIISLAYAWRTEELIFSSRDPCRSESLCPQKFKLWAAVPTTVQFANNLHTKCYSHFLGASKSSNLPPTKAQRSTVESNLNSVPTATAAEARANVQMICHCDLDSGRNLAREW